MMITMLSFTSIGFMIMATVALFLSFHTYTRKNRGLPRNLLKVRKFLKLCSSFDQIHDKNVQILEGCSGTFVHKSSWILDKDVLLTSDPANVHHIMSTRFSKYPKGIEWRKRFDVFGDSLFNSDFAEWKSRRAFTRGFLNHQSFHETMGKIFEDSMEKQLIPVLENVSKQDVPVAFQDLLGKHMFYISCKIITGCDPGSFYTSTSGENLFSKAIVDACEAISFRYFLPESMWKLQKWLGIGKEKRLSKASITLHHLISEYISVKRQELMSYGLRKDDMDFSALKLLLLGDEHELAGPGRSSSTSDKVMRDNILELIFAVHSTTSTVLSWFFWLLSKHPAVEKSIRDELRKYFAENGQTKKWLGFGAKELNEMVYLHSALCETLRLYPPVPSQSRTALENDILPSGHKVNQSATVIISAYAMGRMRSIWGEDCLEFKPERWIADDGGIKHEAANKFFAFNAGPRICLGKNIAFTLMKAITSAIIHNYDVQVVENHCKITPKPSIIMHMNHDLMVTVKKRWA